MSEDADYKHSRPTTPAIVSTRLFAHQRELVFKAFSDPEFLVQWWGPEGFTNSFIEFDFRPGGNWSLVMQGPNGMDHRIEKQFVDIVPPERIVLLNLHDVHQFHMIMTFVEESGKTRLTWSMHFESEEEAEKVRGPVIEANEQNFDRLEAQLRAMA